MKNRFKNPEPRHLSREKDVLYVYVDGACNNAEGKNQMGIGISILYEAEEMSAISEYAGEGTNNEAEFIALRKGLIEANFVAALLSGEQFEVKKIKVYSDSQIIVNTYNGDWVCRQPSLKPLLRKCWDIKHSFPLEVSWIPRELNHRADVLSKEELINLGYRTKKVKVRKKHPFSHIRNVSKDNTQRQSGEDV